MMEARAEIKHTEGSVYAYGVDIGHEDVGCCTVFGKVVVLAVEDHSHGMLRYVISNDSRTCL